VFVFQKAPLQTDCANGGCKASARVAHGSRLSSLRPPASAPARPHHTLRSIFICHSTHPSMIRCVRAQTCHAQLHLQAVRPPRRYITFTKLAERPLIVSADAAIGKSVRTQVACLRTRTLLSIRYASYHLAFTTYSNIIRTISETTLLQNLTIEECRVLKAKMVAFTQKLQIQLISNSRNKESDLVRDWRVQWIEPIKG